MGGQEISVADLLLAKQWARAQARLAEEIGRSNGLTRVQQLAQRCHAERGLARLDLARQSLAEASDYAEAESIVIPVDERLQLAEQLERNGQLRHAAKMLAPANHESHAARLHGRVSEAIEHSLRLESLPIKIIAVGQNCLPDHLAIRWGFAPLMVSGPFAAAMFIGNGSASAIADDFQAFDDPAKYRLTKSIKGFAMAILPHYEAELNHQLGSNWLDPEFKRIRALYRTRIADWRAALAAGPVLFVASRIGPGSIAKLWRALEASAPHTPKRLVVIDFMRDAETLARSANVRVIPATYPDADYRWYTPRFYTSSAGIGFERALAQTLIAEAEELGRTS